MAAWIRGKYDGGAIPLRFFLVPYRVISDTYGVFVYDADAGFVRGYEPSLDFTFYGWHNGSVAIKHKDGTVYSALSGRAISGPGRGSVLKPIPTLETDWGYWLSNYPGTVAYHMFDKYQAHALPSAGRREALRSRPKPDKRLDAAEPVIGLEVGGAAKVFPIRLLEEKKVLRDKIGSQEVVVLWYPRTRTAALYAPRMENDRVPERLKLEWNEQLANAPFMDRETFSHWDITGRAVEGPLKGKTLVWLPAVQCKWAAWAGEYPRSEIYSPHGAKAQEPEQPMMARLIEGHRLDWDRLWKFRAQVEEVRSPENLVTLLAPAGHKVVLEASPQTEIYVRGWWGDLDDFVPGQAGYAIVATNDAKGLELHALADEMSIQAMSGPFSAVGRDGRGLLFRSSGGRSLSLVPEQRASDGRGATITGLPSGTECYFNSSFRNGERSLLALLDKTSFEADRATRQKAHLQKAATEGVVAQVIGGAGENRLELLVRRADSAFARIMRPGNTVEAAGGSSDSELHSWRVAELYPDYSRTRIVVESDPDTARKLPAGTWVKLRVPLPSAFCFDRPPDLGRFTERQKRIDYFLSTIYCACGMMGTACAGHWNTLAACKLHGCGMPNIVTRLVGEWIDQGQTDEQVLEGLVKRDGEAVLRQHQLASPLFE